MPAYLVLGPSGTGKTSLGVELKKRGVRAVDTDWTKGLTSWVNIATGEKVPDLQVRPYPAEWLDAHLWLWDVASMKRLIDAARGGPVFFVGGADNEEDFLHLFACRFALVADSATLVQRLRRRDPARYSEGSVELQRQLDWHEQCRSYYLSTGAILVDSSVSVELVADTVLKHVGQLEKHKSRKVYWVLRLHVARTVRAVARKVRNMLYSVRRAGH